MRNRIPPSLCETLMSSKTCCALTRIFRRQSAASVFEDVISPRDFSQGLTGNGHTGQPIMQSS
jgi:hypothetical protein